LDRLSGALRRRLEAHGGNLVRYHNPFVRHVVKRRRRDLRNPDGTPVFREVPIRLHGEGDGDALTMSDKMAAASDDACAYRQLVARIRPGTGILKTLLLRRIGSSLPAGLLTARRLRDGEERVLLGEEEDSVTREGVSDIGGEALQRLESAIALMESAGDDQAAAAAPASSPSSRPPSSTATTPSATSATSSPASPIIRSTRSLSCCLGTSHPPPTPRKSGLRRRPPDPTRSTPGPYHSVDAKWVSGQSSPRNSTFRRTTVGRRAGADQWARRRTSSEPRGRARDPANAAPFRRA